jgi:hypothetical protein
MGETYNGFSEGIDFDNQADAGANLNSNEVERQELYGAPLGPADLAYNDSADSQYLADQNKSNSIFNRYLAITNPSSLLSRLSLPIVADIHNFSFSSVLTGLKTVLNPLKLASGLADLFRKNTVSATQIDDTSDYGIIQWGYTVEENALIHPSSSSTIPSNILASYQPLENSQVLFNSGEDQYIQSTYGPCYSLTIGQLLTTQPSAGPDQSDNYIVRDSSGNVTGGLCSQKYLGPNSADPKAADSTYGNDLIFRWRINHAYNNVIDQLNGASNITTN